MPDVLTKDDFLTFKTLDPLEEDYALVDYGGRVIRIKGITEKSQLIKLGEEYSKISENTVITDLGSNPPKQYRPKSADFEAATWCSLCVVEPALTPTEWLIAELRNPLILDVIRTRCVACSHFGIKAAQENEAPTIEGVEAAKLEAETNPFP